MSTGGTRSEARDAESGPLVWVLTDGRYLRQRMPLALVDALERAGVRTRLLAADEALLEPGAAGGPDPWGELRAGDAVVARTRSPFALALLRAAERPGVRVLTPWAPVAAVRNKAWAVQVLARRGVPMPRTVVAEGAEALRALSADRFPLVLKPYLGDNGRGIVHVRDAAELDDVRWDAGVVLAQEYVETDGVDLKLYAAGEDVWAVRRPSPLRAAEGADTAERVPVTAELRGLARACGEAFALELFGVDVLESPHGPLVVDVNEFPNYTGVDEAPAAVAGVIRAALDADCAVRRELACAS